MKKLLILITLCCISCKSYKQETPKESKVYTYVVPSLAAEKIIYENIMHLKAGYTVFLELEITSSGYNIWVIPTTKNIENAYFGYLKVLHSNRTMHINGKLYPMVFSTDMTLAGKIDLNKVGSFEKREANIKRGTDDDDALLVYKKSVIYDHAIVIKFDRDWNQIKE